MSAFWYGLQLQCRLDIRSKSLLITCYLVPLLFFVFVGSIFIALDPQAKQTLIPHMTVMGVSMGALIGVPPTLAEIYGSDIKGMYRANGVPLWMGLVNTVLSALVHLLVMSTLLCGMAVLLFNAPLPDRPLTYVGGLVLLVAVSLALGSVLGLAIQDQAKLTMLSQLFFLPSILLSGILFPLELLPKALQQAGMVFPAFWGGRLLTGVASWPQGALPLLALFGGFVLCCAILLRRMRRR